MKLTFLGTGTSQGIPVITCECPVCTSADPRDNRLRTSAMLEVDDKVFVIDTGPDFRQQMLRAGAKRLDGVVFTHQHKDHTAGMDDVRAFNFRQRSPIEAYANAGTITSLKNEFSYVFADEKYPGVPSVNLHEITDAPFTVAGVEFIPIPVLHYKLPVLGFRVGDVAYITDANFIPEASMARLRGLKVLVLNALRKKQHLSHFTLDEAIDLVNVLKPERAYFTHISHLMGPHAEVAPEIPAGMELAVDGLVVEV